MSFTNYTAEAFAVFTGKGTDWAGTREFMRNFHVRSKITLIFVKKTGGRVNSCCFLVFPVLSPSSSESSSCTSDPAGQFPSASTTLTARVNIINLIYRQPF